MSYRHINQKSMLVYAAVMLAAYTATLFIPIGWGTYFLALPAYLIVMLTCVARANELDKTGPVYDARRFGFSIMLGLTAMVIVEPIFGSYPKWPRVFGYWALSLIWMTTESLPPWWEWVTGAWNHHSFFSKLKLFGKSLHGTKPEPPKENSDEG